MHVCMTLYNKICCDGKVNSQLMYLTMEIKLGLKVLEDDIILYMQRLGS